MKKTILGGILALFLLSSTFIISAQDTPLTNSAIMDGQYLSYIVVEENLHWEDIFAEYHCAVGILTFNRDARLNDDGSLVTGQSLIIPTEHMLCEIDYSGEILFLELDRLPSEIRGTIQYGTASSVHVDKLAVEYNVCVEVIQQLNPDISQIWASEDWDGFIPFEHISYLRIPLDAPACFEEIQLENFAGIRSVALSLNVCEQLIWYYNNYRYSPYSTGFPDNIVFIPIERQPCYQDGQLLVDYSVMRRYQENAYYVEAEAVNIDIFMTMADFVSENGYCLADLQPLNDFLLYRQDREWLQAGERVFIPADVRHCDIVTIENKTVREISQEYNICLEDLLSVNANLSSWSTIALEYTYDGVTELYGATIAIPQGLPPCYDETGLRIGHHDRAVHETSRDEWLFKIAQDYNVCLEDLVEANSLLQSYPITRIPSLLFIPDVPPCTDVQEDGMVHFVADSKASSPDYHATVHIAALSYIFNVCIDRIYFANADVGTYPLSGDSRESAIYPTDTEILIPVENRPCYDFYLETPHFGHYFFGSNNAAWSSLIVYICYEEEINPRQDYSGHEPVINPVEYSLDAYCYDLSANPYVVINNENYVLFPAGMVDVFRLGECFGVNPYDIIQDRYTLESEDGYLYIPANIYYTYQSYSYWAIPNPTLDCPFVGNNWKAIDEWDRRYQEGTVRGEINDEGLYIVEGNDTLSSIGRRYGYLPDWIKAENNLPNNLIYPYQALRLPTYPNIYQTGQTLAFVLTVLVFGLLIILFFRWRERRYYKAKITAAKAENDSPKTNL